METTEISLHLRAARAAAVLAYLGDRALDCTGLSMNEMEVLAAIGRKTYRASVSALARELGVERTRVSRLLVSLQEREMVTLERRNASSTRPQLTETGRNALAMLHERWEAEEARLREVLGEAYPGVVDALRLLTNPKFGAQGRVAPLYGEFLPPRNRLSAGVPLSPGNDGASE